MLLNINIWITIKIGLSIRTATRSGSPHRTAAVRCGLQNLQSARVAGSNRRTRADLRVTARVLMSVIQTYNIHVIYKIWINPAWFRSIHLEVKKKEI
jgi:hypothetical protein